MGNARCFFPIFLLATLLSIALPSPFNFIYETTHTLAGVCCFVFAVKTGRFVTKFLHFIVYFKFFSYPKKETDQFGAFCVSKGETI